MATSSPTVSSLAGRYGNALFELAQESRAVAEVGNALAAFVALLDQNADLARMVASPVFSTDEQGKALAAVLAKAGISGLAANFLLLLAARRRLAAVRSIVEAYKALADDAAGIRHAEVRVAAPLSEAQGAELEQVLAQVLGAKDGGKIVLSQTLDPSLIGGLVVKIGSRMIDASLKTRLNAMKRAMIQA